MVIFGPVLYPVILLYRLRTWEIRLFIKAGAHVDLPEAKTVRYISHTTVGA